MITVEFYNKMEEKNLSAETYLNLLCDYFDSAVLEEFFEFVEEQEEEGAF